MCENRRDGGGLQCLGRQRRGVGVPQHALQAGLANGTLVEHHHLAVELCKRIYRGLPEPVQGVFVMSDQPGLGFEPDRDAIREIAKLPPSQGRSKG